jgi:hypothetical protein
MLETIERRKAVRYSSRQKTFCYLIIQEDKAIGPLEVRNLSVGGFSLILDHRLTQEIGQAINLYHNGQQTWHSLPIKEEYVITLPDGKFIVSGSFSEMLSEADVQEFL